MVNTCKNCSYPTDNNYCPQCGQKTSVSRFSMKHLLEDFIHGFFHVDHGIFFTAKELAIRPGTMLRNYLTGQRIKYFNPFTFILIFGGISAMLLKQLHWQSLFVDLGIFTNKNVDKEVWNSSIKHFSLRLLASIPLYTFVSWLFYYQKKLNFSEHLIINTYLRGESSLIMLIIAPLTILVHGSIIILDIKLAFYGIVLIYFGWAYASLFNEKVNFRGFIKGCICAFLASLLELGLLNLFIKK
jgi:Protein of unknown function (DUF3667)